MGWAQVRRLWQPRRRRQIALGGFCLALTALPLFGTLGYENAFVLAPVIAGLSIVAGVDHVRSASPPAMGPWLRNGAREIASYHGIAVGVLLLGRWWQPGCDLGGGLLFYGMGPLCSSLIGWSCGIWAGTLPGSQRARRALGLAPFIITTLIGLWRLYVHPVVFAYDPFWGYFSGSIYDESIAVDRRYLFYRAYNLLAVSGAWAVWMVLFDPRTRRWRLPLWRSAGHRLALSFALASGWAAVRISVRAAELGFTANLESITEQLSGTYETPHFIIHYPPRSPYARIIEDLATEHEFAWHVLRTAMDREPKEKVRSFLFEDAKQKRRLMGAGTVQVAAPWRGQIYLDHRGFPHAVLHHELAHVFAATIGDPVLGISLQGLLPNMGLIEGLATALAPRTSGRLDLHDQAKVLGVLERRPDLSAIMGPGFFAQASRVAYIAAGSFCRWLIDAHGFERMATLYRNGGDFEDVYGVPLSTLEREWIAFLDDYDGVTPADVEIEAERFLRRSVFQRPCAHVVAELRHAVARAQQRGQLEEAVDRLQALCALEPEQPDHKIALAMGLARDGRYADAQAVLVGLVDRDDLPSTVRAAVAERQGDIALAAGEHTAAQVAFERALAEPIPDDHRRVLLLKRLAALDPTLRDSLQRYFGELSTPAQAAVTPLVQIFIASQLREAPQHRALGSYLLGRLMLNVQEIDAAHHMFEEALALREALPDPLFVRAAQEAAMTTALQRQDITGARHWWTELENLPHLGHGERRDLDEWQARIEFFAATSPS